MSEFSRFPLLPKELRDMVWDFACPELIVEFGEPSDQAVPEDEFRDAWVASRRPVAMAQACRESRAWVMRESVDREGTAYIDGLVDKRCRLRIAKIIHFNPSDYNQMSRETRFIIEDTLNGSSKALELGKMVSLHADLINPFTRPRDLCDMSDRERYWFLAAFCKLSDCIITLHTVSIRATKEQAARFGVFDGGEEPIIFVDVNDASAIRPFMQLWWLTKHEDVAATNFFELLETRGFNFRIARWRSEMESRFVQFARKAPPYGPYPTGTEPPQVANSVQFPIPINHGDPIVKAYLKNMPKLKLCVMFRLVPPQEAPVGDMDRVPVLCNPRPRFNVL